MNTSSRGLGWRFWKKNEKGSRSHWFRNNLLPSNFNVKVEIKDLYQQHTLCILCCSTCSWLSGSCIMSSLVFDLREIEGFDVLQEFWRAVCICEMNIKNERGGRVNCFVSEFSSKAYLGRVRVAYLAPEVHELVAQSRYPRRWSCLDRANPVIEYLSSKYKVWRSAPPNPFK
jgi:hypothetical protein